MGIIRFLVSCKGKCYSIAPGEQPLFCTSQNIFMPWYNHTVAIFGTLSSSPSPSLLRTCYLHTTRRHLSVVLNTFCRNGPLGLLRRFHEEWKDRPQAENVDKLVAVVLALWTYQRVVEHFEGTVPRHLLLPE